MQHTMSGILLIFVIGCSITSAVKEISIPVSDAGEGTRCDSKDGEAADICFRCTRLSPIIAVQLTDCCTQDKAFDVCQRCVSNKEECEAEILALQEANEENDEPSDDLLSLYPDVDSDVMEKRFGTTFMGSSRFGYPRKRYGKIYFGGRRGGYGYPYGKRSDNNMDKRYGKLFLSRNRGKYGYGYGNKRYGSLFTGNSKYWK